MSWYCGLGFVSIPKLKTFWISSLCLFNQYKITWVLALTPKQQYIEVLLSTPTPKLQHKNQNIPEPDVATLLKYTVNIIVNTI